MRPEPLTKSTARPLGGAVVPRRVIVAERPSDMGTHVVAVLLASIALVSFAVLQADGRFDSAAAVWCGGQLLAVLVGAVLLRRHARHPHLSQLVSPLMVLVAVSALAWEWLSRQFLEQGLPFELLTMSVVRNLVAVLAIASVWAAHQRTCAAASLFLTMFSVTASQAALSYLLAGLFAVTAVCWLIASYWEDVRQRLPAQQQRTHPRVAVVVPVLLLLVIGAGMSSSDPRVNSSLRGFLNSSGGHDRDDPAARRGVGHGEMLVAGTNQIQSFAPIEDAPFMQDDQPSLYDLFDETYEEEDDAKARDTDRAIALPPDLADRARQHLHSQTEKAHREFSTRRQSRDRSHSHAPDIRSDALFYVAGRVPLHLRLEVYDLFDGTTWYPEPLRAHRPPLTMTTSNGKPWLALGDSSAARNYLGPAETHAIKVVNLDTTVIPAPLYLHGIHIDLVERSDIFRPGPDGLVAMQRERLPALVPIHLASRSIARGTLSEQDRLFLRIHSEQPNCVIPDNIDSEALRRLAESWSVGCRPGWPQIEAIAEHLRTGFRLDPDWRPADSRRTGVEQFLFDSRRGPDYQFATATALLLRSLGYPSRVVSGFYADPAAYDEFSRHTPVHSDNVHFWTEVRVAGGDWITVESTPGYTVLEPPPGFWQRVGDSVAAAGQWCLRHWFLSGSLLALAGLLHRKRKDVGDAWLTLRWKLGIWWAPQRCVEFSLRMLRQRARLADAAPPVFQTHHSWLGELMARNADGTAASQLSELRRLVDRTAYSPTPVPASVTLLDTCRACIRSCTLDWFRSQSEGLSEVCDGPQRLSPAQYLFRIGR